MAPQVLCIISLEHFQMKPTLPINVLQSLHIHLAVVRNFISLGISSELVCLMSLGINSHILQASEDMLSVLKCTLRFFCLCSSGPLFKLYSLYKVENIFHNSGSK